MDFLEHAVEECCGDWNMMMENDYDGGSHTTIICFGCRATHYGTPDNCIAATVENLRNVQLHIMEQG